MFAFRDAAHFYYPLFQLIRDEWAAGRIPLWNPYENLGQPLAGNPTASVFYPGKLIFALPLDYTWAYKIYVMAHVLLAATAAYRLARHFDASVYAAGVCAISYAFSGNVLFQYCNVVFLVGAAWLPLAMLSAYRMLVEKSPHRAVAFGTVLGLMVLGGDPQMAYNAGLLAAAYALWLWWTVVGCVQRTTKQAEHNGHKSSANPSVRCTHPTRTRPALLALAAVIGLVLSAVQVLPSMEFASRSGRHADRSVDSLLGKGPDPGTHGEHIYHFSVGPWRLTEYLWPNFGGRQFPIHRRWLEVIPAEGRIWTPSLYMGLLPLLLALAAMRFRRKKCFDTAVARDVWLTWTIVAAIVASFGWYGLGWLMHEIRVATGGDPLATPLVGDPFGGLYWLMTLLLPGYAYFRYPAKLLVVAALGLSLLAARGWEQTCAGTSRRFRFGLLWLGAISAGGAIVALAIRPFWSDWLSGVEPDVLFGPLDTSGAANDLLWAFTQTAVLCGLFWLPRKKSSDPIFLALVAVDLAVANGWMVVCAPASQWEQPSQLAVAMGEPSRVYRHPIWLQPQWKSAGSPQRLAEAMRWDRDTLWPKYSLMHRVPILEVYGAMVPYDYEAFLRAKKGTVPFSLAEYVILPGNRSLPAAKRIDVEVEDVSLWHDPQHLPRAWIVHDVDVLPPLRSYDPASVRRRTEEVLYPQDRPRDLRNSAAVEYAGELVPGLPATRDSLTENLELLKLPHESCRLVHHDPSHVEIEAELQRPGLVVLCDQFYPGWRLEVEETSTGKTVSAAIMRTNRVMRGTWLPAGSYRLTYRYHPASFVCGATVSGLGWLAIALWIGWRVCSGLIHRAQIARTA